MKQMRAKFIYRFSLLIVLVSCTSYLQAQNDFPFKDPDLPMDQRINDLISRMTIDQKIEQLHFDAPAIPALGVKNWGYWNEALHGVARHDEATVFPQVIGLGSTWNPELIKDMAVAIGKEARVFNNKSGKGLTYFSPTINVARDPRWGRTEEAYSEDPYLTGRMGVAFVEGLQSKEGTDYMLAAATVKHFVADNSEFQRSISSSYTDMRDLREYYFPAFKTSVEEAKTISVMSTYRGLNGIPNSANFWLLDNVLRKEWGFEGYVVSDCWAVSDIVNRQQYVTENEKAVQLSLLAGTDLNCGDYYIKHLKSAYNKAYVSEDDIDRALARVMKARFLLGDFDPDERVLWRSLPDDALNSPEHQQLALDLARESMVLFKNEGNTLPLEISSAKSFAVIGAKAEEPEYGGYTGYPNQAVTILQGIRYKLGAAQNGFETIKAERFHRGSYMKKIIDFSSFEKQNFKEGGRLHPVQVKNNDWMKFRDIDLGDGAVAISVNAATKGSGGIVELRLDALDGRVIGEVVVQNTGEWNKLENFVSKIKKSKGIHDIYLKFKGNGEVLFNFASFEFIPSKKDYVLTDTRVKVSYAKGCEVNSSDKSGFDEAIKIASENERVIFVYGTDLTVANEGLDPADLDVPSIQRELLKKIYEVNPNVILVMAVGFPLIIDWEKENIPAILGAWYGGQAQGTAVSDILFGDYNPGGKLAMTWYKSEDQLPSFTNYRIRKNNRTYQYFNEKVLFPFGYGLSYTEFEYTNLETNKSKFNDTDDIQVSIEIQNTGNFPGDEVVQLYYKDVESSVKTPLRKLVAFERVHLKPNESKIVKFRFPAKDLGFWSIKNNGFIIEPGLFKLMAGSSSEDIRLSQDVYIDGETYEQGIIRINAGGGYYKDNKDTEWMPDYGFDFGLHASTDYPTDNTDDPTIYQTARKKCDPSTVKKIEYPNSDYLYKWQYTTCDTTGLYYYFEVLNGKYDVILHFSELECLNENERIFNVEIEGEKLVNDLDIFKEVGFNSALTLSFSDIKVSDNYLNIDFIESIGFPCVSGIEIIPVD